jgi:hypothetical protein
VAPTNEFESQVGRVPANATLRTNMIRFFLTLPNAEAGGKPFEQSGVPGANFLREQPSGPSR